jgi:hypothetical protein
MLLGKTDLEVFPDELAMELHEADRRIAGADGPVIEMHLAGQGEQRGEHCWFGFTIGEPGHPLTGSGCLLIATRERLPRPSPARCRRSGAARRTTRQRPGDDIAGDGRVRGRARRAGAGQKPATTPTYCAGWNSWPRPRCTRRR